MANMMEFSNRAGVELHDTVVKRASEELSGASNFDTFSAMLGATLIATAYVLRGPIERGANVEELLDFSKRWLRTLLEPAINQSGGTSGPGA